MSDSASYRFQASTAGYLSAFSLRTREIAFIDPNVDAIDILLAGLRPEIEAILLSAVEPALRQIARVVADRRDLEAIHVIAHGAPGEVLFAAGTLSARTFGNDADELAHLGRSMRAGEAKLLLWACNTGAGGQGAQFVDALAGAAGMAVAASAQRIGTTARGGRWELDRPSRAPLTEQGVANYGGILGITVNLAPGSGTTAFTEQTLVTMFPSATFSATSGDNNAVDSITIVLASDTPTMSLSLNATAAAAATTAGVTATYDPNSGTLTLSGSNESNSVWQSILQGVQYNDSSNTPTNPGTVTVTARNGSSTDSDTQVVSVTSVNDAPVVAAGTIVSYIENGIASAITTTATITDADSLNFNTGSLTVSLTANGTASDQLRIQNQGAGAGQIGVSGTNVTYGGVTIGTLSGGTNGSNLVVSFTSTNATPAAAQALMRAILYSNSSEAPSTAPRTVTFTVNDGDGTANGGTNIGSATATVSVSSVNDAPVLAAGTTLTYTENGAASAIATTATVTDVDSANFNNGSLTASFTANGSTSDQLSIQNQGAGAGQIGVSGANVTYGGAVIGTFSGGTNGADLVVSFNASATPTATQALMRTILYSNSSDAPTAVSRTVSFALNDGTSIGTATATVDVSTVNDAPVLSIHEASVAYAENADAQALLTGVTLADPDSPENFNGGSIAISLTGAVSGDELRLMIGGAVTLSGSNVLVGGTIVGTVAAGGLAGGQTSATISLGSNATATNVNSVLQALAFDSASDNPTPASRTATVTLNDGGNTGSGGAKSDSATVTINVTPINDPAVLSSDALALTETNAAADISATGQLTISDVDNSAMFLAQSDVLGQYGKFSIGVGGAWSYVANSAHDEFVAGQTYTDTFAVHSADGTPTAVAITLIGTNDLAVITGTDIGEVTEAGGVAGSTPGVATATGTLIAADVDSAAIFAVQTDAAADYGQFSIGADGVWTYTLDNDNAAVQALDVGNTLHDVLNVATADGTAHQIAVTITGSNDAALIAGIDTGAVTEAGGAANGFPGEAVATGTLSATDVDGAATFVVQTDAAAGHGRFSIASDGTWIYTLDDNDAAVQALNERDTLHDLIDVALADGTTHQIDIAITGSNDAPVIAETSTLAGNLDEDTILSSVSGQILAEDVDNAMLIFAGDGYGNFGSLVVNPETGGWTYTLDDRAQGVAQGQTGTDSFEITVTDETGATVGKTVKVTITGANDAPEITMASVLDGAVEEDASVTVGGQIDAKDADNGAILTFGAGDGDGTSAVGEFGTLVVDPVTGAWTYALDDRVQKLAQEQTEFESFQVTVSDESGANGTAAVTIIVTGSNDAAVISGNATGAVVEDDTTGAGSTLSVADPDGGEAVFQAPASLAGVYGDFAFDPLTGEWSYALNAAKADSLAADQEVHDTLTVASLDGTASQLIDVSVIGSNGAPVISSAPQAGAVQEDVLPSVSGQVTATDADLNATLAFSGNAAGVYGAFAVDAASGAWTYTLDDRAQGLAAGESHDETFTVTVTDDQGAFATQAVTLTVTGSNDAPVISSAPQAGAVQEDVLPSVSGQVTATDADLNATLAFSGNAAGVYGAFAVDAASGAWTYTLDDRAQGLAAGESHDETFTVTVTDDQGAFATQAVTLTVTGSNGAPVISSAPQAGAVQEDVLPSVSGQVTATDADLNATLAFSGNAAGVYGAFAVDAASGAWTYTLDDRAQGLAAGESHDETFTVTVTDDQGAFATQAVTLTVTGSNDAPVISSAPQAGAVQEDVLPSVSGQVTATDADLNATLAFSGNAAGVYGAFAVDAASGAWTYTLDDRAQGLAAGESHDETFTVTVTDDQGAFATQAVTLTVTGSNGAPVISSAPQAGAVQEDVLPSVSGQVTATDADLNATLAFSGNAAGVYGAFAVDAASGAWTYTLDDRAQGLAAGESHDETFTVTVTDDQGAFATQAVTLTVTGSNDAPVISSAPQAGAVQEDVLPSVSGQVTATDADLNATLAFSGNAAGVYGAFAVDAASGAWTYTLDDRAQGLAAGESHDETFTVTVTDDQGAFATQAVTLTVTGSNDAPTISGPVTSTAVEEGAPSTLDALAHATDVDDGATLSVTNLPDTLPSGVSFNVATHSFTLDPSDPAYQHLANGVTVNVSVSYAVSDGIMSTPASVSWTVTSVNHAPVVAGTVTGVAIEDGVLSTLNALANASDTDSGTTLVVTDIPGTLPAGVSYEAASHAFVLDPSNLAFQHLVNGETAVVSVNYTVSDGIAATPATASWTMTGSNDAAMISGIGIGAVAVNGASSASGTLSVTDPDSGEAMFQAPAATAMTGSYGDFAFDPISGAWSYALDAARANSLAAGQVVQDTLNVASFDGSASQLINVSVTGRNAPPAPSAPDLSAASDSGVSNTDNITNITTPIFAGTADSGAMVTLYDGSTAVGTGIANAGNWTITTSTLANGTHSITAKATDAAGNVGEVSGALSVTIDGAVPGGPSMPDLLATSDNGASSTDNITNSPAPTFSGTAEVGSTVTLYDGATLVGTGIANAGNWTITASTLTNGTHSITAKATDVAGNLGSASGALAITIDGAVPGAPSMPDLVATSDSGASSTDNITNITTPTFSGTAEVGSTVTLYDGATLVGTAVTATTGKWTITSATLAGGVHAMTATARDVAGNISAVSAGLGVTIQTTVTAPSAPDLVAGSDSGASNTDDITKTVRPDFIGTAAPGSTVTLYDGTTVIGTAKANATTGKWTINSTKLSGGVHDITAVAVDKFGNLSAASPALSVTIDTAAPAAPSAPDLIAASDTGVSSTDNITKAKTPTFTGTAEAGATVAIYNGTTKVGTSLAGADGAWTITTSAMGNGSHRMTTKATDAAGNVSVASGALSITIDATALAAPKALDLTAASDTGVSKTDNITNIATPSFMGTAEAASTITLYDGAIAVGTGITTNAGTWSIMASSLANGTHSLTAKATDALGNVSPASSTLSVNIDTAAPGAPVITGGTASTLSGTGEAGATVTILDMTTTLGTATVGSGGRWNWSFTAGSSTRSLSAIQTDQAGNKSAASSGSVLIGTNGANTLTSTAGDDILIGKAGADTFSFGSTFGLDVISDFAATGTAHDIIRFHGSSTLNSFANVLSRTTQVGSGVAISQDDVNVLMLNNVSKASLVATDFSFV